MCAKIASHGFHQQGRVVGVCVKAVHGDLEVMECNCYKRWVHRLCDTSMSQKQYRAVTCHLKRGGKFDSAATAGCAGSTDTV